MKPEGDFYSPEKGQYKPGERPTPKRPVDNLRPEGDFYSPEKQEFKPVERPKQVKPTDNLRQEGTMNVTKKNEFAVISKTDKRVDNKQTGKKTAASHIMLGEEDSSVMRTTNQINYNSSAIANKRMDTTIEKVDMKDKEIKKDGAIMITTKTVTTVLASDAAKKAAKGRKNVSTIGFEDVEDTRVTRKVVQNGTVTNGTKEHIDVVKSSTVQRSQTEHVSSSHSTSNVSHIEKSSSTTSSKIQESSNIQKGVTSVHEKTTGVISDSKSSTMQSGEIISKTIVQDQRTIDSQRNKMTNLIAHDSNNTSVQTSPGVATGAQKSSMSSIISQDSKNQQSVVSSSVTSKSTLEESQQHHRKSTFSSSEQMSNSILTRQVQDRQATNEAMYPKGVSITGAQQRKSINNLHEQSQYGGNDRKSLSYMHRTGGNREVTEYHTNDCQLHQQQQKQSYKSSSSSSTQRITGETNASSSFILHEGRSDANNRRTTSYDDTDRARTQTKSSATSSSIGGIMGGYTDSYSNSSTSRVVSSGQSGETRRGSSQQYTSSPAAGMSTKDLHSSTTSRVTSTSSPAAGVSSVRDYSGSFKVTSTGGHASDHCEIHGTQQKVTSTPTAGVSSRDLHSTTNRTVHYSPATEHSTSSHSSSKLMSSGHQTSSSEYRTSSSTAAGMSTKDLHSSSTSRVTSTSSPAAGIRDYSGSVRVTSTGGHSSDHCGIHGMQQVISTPTAGVSSRDLHSTSRTVKSTNGAVNSSSSSNQYSTQNINRYIAATSSQAIKNRNTTSNITFGDSSGGSGGGGNNFSSAYKTEYVKTHYKPCPASHIDKNHMKQTRTTKSHKFFLTEE